MRYLIIILFFPMVSCSQVMGIRATRFNILIVSAGESNEAGYGVNTDLSSSETGPRKTRIYDLTQMAPLRIGSNNFGNTSTQHGFELQLANAKDSGYFGVKNLYLCKTGQGGTRVSQWAVGTDLYNRLIERLNNSIALIEQERNVSPGDSLRLWCLWSLGINDMFAGLSSSDFKTAFDLILDELHSLYPTMKFVLTKFNQPAYTGYNTTYDAIASARSTYCYTIYSASAQYEADNTHWGTEGWKTMGRLLTNVIISN